MMTRYLIVQFPDNTYGVQKKTLFGKSYLSVRSWAYWHDSDEFIYGSCRFDKMQDAKNAMLFVKHEYKELSDD